MPYCDPTPIPRYDVRQEHRCVDTVTAIRFWSWVDRFAPRGCWDWKGALGGAVKAPVFKLPGKTVSARRTAFWIAYGLIPDDWKIKPSCGNTVCVNPRHLFIWCKPDETRRGPSRKKTDQQETDHDGQES